VANELDDLLDDLDCVSSSPPAVASRTDACENSDGGTQNGHGDVGAQAGGSTRKCFPVCLAGRS